MTHSNQPLTTSAILILALTAANLHAQQPPDISTNNWPGWRGPNRDGKSPDTGLLKEWPDAGPTLLWKAADIGKGYSSASVADNTIYTTGDTSSRLVISALDINGNLKWTADHDNACNINPPGSRSTPTIDNHNLYILSAAGLVGCYDTAAGKRKWTRSITEFGGRPPDGGCAESVLIYKNLAILTPGGTQAVVALDKTTGATVWTTKGYDAQAQYCSPIAFTHQQVPMIVTGTRRGLVCLSPEDGRILWSDPWCEGNTFNCTTPVYSDGYIFWSNGSRVKGGVCLKLDVTAGKVTARRAWTTNDLASFHGGYIVHDSHIYGNHNNAWVCLELATGRKCAQARAVGRGSLCYADGMLYLFAERAGAAALMTCSPQNLDLKGTFNVQGAGPSYAHPTIAAGRLYLRYGTNLYCYRLTPNS